MLFRDAIVLTGSIATGKSSVSPILKFHGYHIIDADTIAHGMLDKEYKEIEKLFGKEYIEDKKVDRKKLGELIFSDKKERERLENLLHPLIKKEIAKQSKYFSDKKEPYIIDLPLFYESKNYDIEDVIVVYCTKEQQLQRLMSRNNISKEEAQQKIDTQISIDEKRKLAKYIIDNTKDFAHLQKEVQKLLKLLIQYTD